MPKLLVPVVTAVVMLAGCTGGQGHPSSSRAVKTDGGHSGRVVQLRPAATPTGAQRHYGTTIGRIPGVTYQSDVVVLGGGASSIQSADGSGYVWTVDDSAPGAGKLRVGSVMMATTLATGRVLAIKNVAGGGRQVVLGPVALTDVIKDGKFTTTTPIAVDNPLAYTFPSDPTARQIPDTDAQAGPHSVREHSLTGAGEKKPPTPHLSQIPHDVPSGLPSEGGAAGSVGVTLPQPTSQPTPINEGDVKLTPSCCSPIHVLVDYQGNNGRMHGDLGLDVGHPQIQASVTIGGSHLLDASVKLYDAAAVFFDFNAATRNVDGNKPRTIFRLPVEFTIPVTPFSVSVSFNLSMAIQLAGQATLASDAKYALDGPIGVSFVDGSLKTFTPTVKTVTSLSKSAFSAGVSVNAISLAFNASLSIGFGVPGLHVGPYVGITASLAFDKDGSPPLTSLTLGCSVARVLITGVVGVGYSISKPIAKAINFFLKIFNVKPIQPTAGPRWPFTIWDPGQSQRCLKRK
ncbi:hypothetical protein [uncultured Jatrophihabitans sp.]|uniref:hypothetical protein n=1 Tax=uncultured Jatrophihabitans sp. TaxID=1610747 RepID=UPI0035CA5F1D